MSNAQAIQCALVPCAVDALLAEARRRGDAPLCIMAARSRNARNAFYTFVALEVIFTLGAVLSARTSAIKGEYACIAFTAVFGLLTILSTVRLHYTTSSLQYFVNHQQDAWVLEEGSEWNEVET